MNYPYHLLRRRLMMLLQSKIKISVVSDLTYNNITYSDSGDTTNGYILITKTDNTTTKITSGSYEFELKDINNIQIHVGANIGTNTAYTDRIVFNTTQISSTRNEVTSFNYNIPNINQYHNIKIGFYKMPYYNYYIYKAKIEAN